MTKLERAFPIYNHMEDTLNSGMSLRDYFAGQALTRGLAYTSGYTLEVIAAQAYALADAMLKERDKT